MKDQAFWETKRLDQLDENEWESLCDGCGRCCLQKLQNDFTEDIHYTNLSCRQLDLESCRCKDYPNRAQIVPECVQISAEKMDDFFWLPDTCAYRLVSEAKPLYDWHPLISGTQQTVVDAGISVAGKAKSEEGIPEHKWEDHIIRWVKV